MGCYWLIRPDFLAISTNPYDMLWGCQFCFRNYFSLSISTRSNLRGPKHSQKRIHENHKITRKHGKQKTTFLLGEYSNHMKQKNANHEY